MVWVAVAIVIVAFIVSLLADDDPPTRIVYRDGESPARQAGRGFMLLLMSWLVVGSIAFTFGFILPYLMLKNLIGSF